MRLSFRTVHHNTAILSHLVMNTDIAYVPMNSQPAEYRRAALLELYRTVEMERVGYGNGTIVGIYIGVCACVLLFSAYVGSVT